MALVNGYPIVSEKSVAPACSKHHALFKAKSKTETATANTGGVGWGGGGGPERQQWEEMGERCEEGS